MNSPKYSFIIPVYNRPDELAENLLSLSALTFTNFEVVIVEDGSAIKSDEVVENFKDQLSIIYHFKKNEGPGIGRNVGAKLARGEILIFVDSDCIVPPKYLDIIEHARQEQSDVFGGPDRAHQSFNTLQKAISFSMTNLLTTGGIRGQKKSVERYYPRSFNLGIRKSTFMEMGGFPLTKMHPGEDMVFGIELIRRGYQTQYIHDAFVYHKRRSTLKQFYHQVRKFGKVRYYITRLYPYTFKITYLFPLAFVLYVAFSVLLAFFNIYWPLYLLALYILALFLTSSLLNRSLMVGIASILTSFVQFFGYAYGLAQATLKHWITGRDEYDVLNKPLFGE